jgi:hypothetical protein
VFVTFFNMAVVHRWLMGRKSRREAGSLFQ